MQNRREALKTVLAGSAAATVAGTLHAAKGGGGAELAVPILTNVTDAATGAVVGQLGGVFTVSSFVVSGSNVIATGTLNGKLTNLTGATGVLSPTSGSLVNTISQAVTMIVSTAGTTCNVLQLTLGPLDLTLLGLHIHLNQVVLTIDANPAGGLLGQLLCALAGGGALQTIANLLQQILGILSSV
jgi:hypothetical protein